MGRRIVGQCFTSDFKYLEQLSDAMNRGIEPDLTNLTSRQKMAVAILHHFQICGVKFEVLLKIKVILVWEDEDKKTMFEYKLLKPDHETATILRTMTPIKGGKQ